MSNRLWAGAALVAIAATVAAGCGGGDGDGGNDAYAGSKADYAAALNSICASVDAKIDPSSEQDLADKGDEYVATFSDAIKQVKSLTPPDEIADAVDAFVANSEEQLAVLEDVVQAAKDGDEAKVQELGEQGSELNKAADEHVNAIGATTCLSTS